MQDYRIIIFEGSECSGKSLLKKKLEIDTNFRHLCVDRMFVTSIVYNRYKSRHPELEKTLYNDLDIFIKTFNPLFVVLNVDSLEREKRFVNRGDWYIKKEELEKIQKNYDKVVEELIIKYSKNFLVFQNNNEKDQLDIIKIIKEVCRNS